MLIINLLLSILFTAHSFQLSGRGTAADLEQIESQLPLGMRAKIVAPVRDSYEYEVLARLGECPVWEFVEYRQAFKASGFQVHSVEVEHTMRRFQDTQALKQWILQEIAPLTTLDPSRYESFAAAYFAELEAGGAIYDAHGQIRFPTKQLVAVVAKR